MSIMFLKVLIEVTLINSALLSILFLPMAIMLVLGVLSSFYFLRGKEKKESPKEVALEQPFAIKPALKFGLLFLLVLLVAKTAQILFGSTGIYVAGIFSGMADVDAITLSMSSLSKAGTITELTASTAILFAAVSNTLVKMGIAFFMGDKKFGRIIIGIFTIILIAGLAVLFFV